MGFTYRDHLAKQPGDIFIRKTARKPCYYRTFEPFSCDAPIFSIDGIGNRLPGRIDRRWRWLYLGLPQAVEVAVGVDSLGGLALGQSKHHLGGLVGIQPLDGGALFGLQSHPGDEVLLGHGVDHRAHDDLDQIALHGDGGDVLLNGSFLDAGFQFDHVLAAALDGYAGGGQLGDDVAAMLTDVEFHNGDLLEIVVVCSEMI